MKNKVSFTLYTSSSKLSKTYRLVEGKIDKNVMVMMYQGTARRVTLSFNVFAKVLSKVTEYQAFGYGLHSDDYTKKVAIVTKGNEDPDNFILSRTKKYFKYQKQPGILMLDHDPSKYGTLFTANQLIAILIEIDPNIAKAARVVRGSVSAGVHLIGKQPKKNNGGFHIYIPVRDATDIPRYGKLLFKHLWLRGHGYIKLSSNGVMLERSAIDAAVFSGERLDFVAPPIISSEGIEYTPQNPINVHGSYLDTTSLNKLTTAQSKKVKALVAEAKEDIRPLSEQKRAEWKRVQIDKMVQKNGITREIAEADVEKMLSGDCRWLPNNFILEFKSGSVSVAEVLTHHEQYDQQSLADPIEGNLSKMSTAMFWWNMGKPIINSFAHGENIVYYLYEQKKQYYKDVEPHFKRKNIDSAHDAVHKMYSGITHWMKNPTGNVAVKASAGIGKTKIIIDIVSKLSRKKKYYEIYVPTHKLGKEIQEKLSKLNIDSLVVRGRSHVDESIGDDEPLCYYSSLVKLISGYGYTIYDDLCLQCKYLKCCGYLHQFRHEIPVRIFTHAHLPLPRNMLMTHYPDVAIIDESFFSVMINNQETTLDQIRLLVKNQELVKVMCDSLTNKEPLLKNLREHFGDNLSDILDAVIKQVRPPKKPVLSSDILNTSNPVNTLTAKLNSSIKKRRILLIMLNQLKAELTKFPKRNASITVRLVDDTVIIAIRHSIKRFTKEVVDNDSENDVPVLCIDADFNFDVASLFLPSIRSKSIIVERNAHIIQVISTTNAKTRFVPRDSGEKKEEENASQHINNVQKIINNVYKMHGKTLIVGFKDLMGNEEKGIAPLLKLPRGCEFVHFKALRGRNDFEDCQVAIIIGRNQLPISALESHAAAFWWDNDKELKLTGEREYNVRGYRSKEKKLGVNVMVCADDRTQLLNELERECELLQGVDRLRLIHNKKIKYVYLLCNIPLDIDVDQLVTQAELIKWNFPFDKALLLAHHSVLPLSPKYLVEHYNKIFANERFVNTALEKAKLSHSFLKAALNKKQCIAFKLKKYNVISFKVKGETFKPVTALVPEGMGKAEAKMCLANTYNVNLGAITIIDSTIKKK
jgi:hypothetical protein